MTLLLPRTYFSIPPELRLTTLATCAPETSLRYGIKHLGPYDRTTRGICGIQTHWIDTIPELTHENIDTLYAGSLVISHYLERHNQQLFPALLDYKGSRKNHHPAIRSYRIYRELSSRHSDH